MNKKESSVKLGEYIDQVSGGREKEECVCRGREGECVCGGERDR